MKKIINIVLVIFFCQFSLAQEYRGKIQDVKQNGYHLIELSPQLRSISQNNINHIRIFDNQNNQVPYVLFSENGTDRKFQDLPIITQEVIENVSTTLVILNEKQQRLSEILLKIANTDVVKSLNISGSHDGTKWFGLVNNLTISHLNDAGENFTERSFNLPLNNYKFIKFVFDDKKSLPINVLKAGLFLDNYKPMQSVALGNFNQKIISDKNNKQTKIEITFQEPQVIDAIKFDIKSDEFYTRKATVFVKQTKKQKRKIFSNNEEIISFSLNFNKSNTFGIPSIFVKKFYIVVENHDNKELNFGEIKLFQNQESLLANLRTGIDYTVLVDNSLQPPLYDLEFATLDHSKSFPKVIVSDFETINVNHQIQANDSFWQSKSFIWICIVIAVVILVFFTFSMIKDLGNN